MRKMPPPQKPVHTGKVYTKGKFLYNGEEKFYIRGVTYGTFSPDEDGNQFPGVATIAQDIAQMAANGFNCIRTYTVPPKYLLDLAQENNLKVMIGLPWEQHITFLDNKLHKKDIIHRVQEGARACSDHPAVLCFAIGNEIPASIVRWYGKEKIEHFLKELYRAVKTVDPTTLVTYVNYPTTEYLDLRFLDFDCWNVYLETPQKLSSYIARLHNLSGDRPIMLAEIGLDSMRNGHEKQAGVLRWQIETIFGKGCAGLFVFAWTDEWWRGGSEIEDWDFGLVDRQRNPKPALVTVKDAMEHIPVPRHMDLPFISVVICSYNGSGTIRETLTVLQNLAYPRFEVIVVNDGSTDNLASIVAEYPVQLLNTPENAGLSNARNLGMLNSKGEIIAYLDDDAYPDPQWLHYLAYAYHTSTHDCIGGPNIAPPEDGPIAICVANAPGGPVHVLETDEIAEHVPGCNMSFKKEALLKIGGFDPVYRAAGDDVDACWRIQKNGGTIGFHPSALVWHHRRNSIKTYWRQQKGYGKAEALLEMKWPEKYNGFGHLTWAGRIYGNGCAIPVKFKKKRVFYGSWGSALFQSVYDPGNGLINALPLMPEWYFVVALSGMLSLLGLLWTSMLWALVLFVASLFVVVIQALSSALNNTMLPPGRKKWPYYSLIVFLHIIQPIARLYGRLKHGLTPWRKRGNIPSYKYLFALGPQVFTYWSETWRPIDEWLILIEQHLIGTKTRIQRGGDFDRWDIQLRNGIVSVNRTVLTIEEHGAGKQFVRLKTWSLPSRSNIILTTFLLLVTILSCVAQAWVVTGILTVLLLLLVGEYLADSAVLLSKLNTAFNAAAPDLMKEASTRSIPTKEEDPVYRLLPEEPRKEDLYATKEKRANTFRKLLTRA